MVERTIPDKPVQLPSRMLCYRRNKVLPSVFRRATQWLTVLIFRPLTGKSKKEFAQPLFLSFILCVLCGL